MNDEHSMVTPAAVDASHQAIVNAVKYADDNRLMANEDPAPKSIAWRERFVAAQEERAPTGPWTSDAARSPLAVATFAVMPATQTLFAMSQLIRPDQQIASFAFEILARAVIEASARAWWLYDPNIGVRERVARGKTVELHSVNEAVKVERIAETDTSHYEQHRNRILAEADKLGLIPDHSSKTEELLGFEGQRRLNATPIIEEMLVALLGDRPASRASYRLYSAVHHSTLYAMMRSLEILGTTKSNATLSPKPTDEEIANSTVFSITAYLGVLARRALLYGHDYKAIDAQRFSLCGSVMQSV